MPETKVKLPKLADSDFKRPWTRQSEYKSRRDVQKDSRFGEIALYENLKDKSLVMVKEKILSSKKAATQEIYALKQRLSNNTPNTLALVDYSCSVKKALCSTTYIIKAIYKLPFNDTKQLML